jgi:hypothetical protein
VEKLTATSSVYPVEIEPSMKVTTVVTSPRPTAHGRVEIEPSIDAVKMA